MKLSRIAGASLLLIAALCASDAWAQSTSLRGPSVLPQPAATSGYTSQATYARSSYAPSSYAPQAYTPPRYAPQPTRGPAATQPLTRPLAPRYAPAPAYTPAAQPVHAATDRALTTYGSLTVPAYSQPTAYSPAYPSYLQANVLMNRADLGGPPVAAPLTQPQAAAPLQVPPSYSQGYLYSHGQAGATVAGGCVACGLAECGCARNWFVGVSGLFMTRDHGDPYAFSFGTADPADQRTRTRDAAMDWSGGFDIRFGRLFNCGENAVEAVYWGLFPERQYTQTTSADVLGNLNGILNWNNLDYGLGTAGDIVNVAPGNDGVHALWRNFEFHNIELNAWKLCGGNCAAGKNGSKGIPMSYNLMAGARLFRFKENLLFGADGDDFVIDFADDEVFYNIDITNDLVGFQLGGQVRYWLNCRWTFDAGLKLGVYGNRISHRSEIGGNLGVAVTNGTPTPQDFFVDNKKNDVAMLGEMNLGMTYCLGSHWKVLLGYRAVAATGVALPADQIWHDLRGVDDVRIIDSNGSLILHGGYLGAEYCF